MLHHDSDVRKYKNVANKSICLVTAVSMVGAFGACIPQSPFAYADGNQSETMANEAPITDPYAIILKLIDVPMDSVITCDDALAFLADHNIDKKGFEAITPEHLASFNAEFAQEICRLQALLKPNASVDPDTPSDPAPSQPSAPSDEDENEDEAPDTPPSSNNPVDNTGNAASTWESDEAAILPLITEDGAGSENISYPQWSYSGDTTFSVNSQASITDSALIALLGESIRDICQEKGVYASVVLAQVILDANSFECDFEPFQNKVFFSEGQLPELVELAKLNEGYDTSKRFKNRFEKCSDMMAYLEDYAGFLSGDMPYANHQLAAAQNLYAQTLQAQADMDDGTANAGAVDGGVNDVIVAGEGGNVVDNDEVAGVDEASEAGTASLGEAYLTVTPREAADAYGAGAVNADASAIANAGASDMDVEEGAGAPESLVLTQEQMDAAYSDMLDSIPASYQEACFWLEQTFGCDEGYALSLLETIDRYDLTRYDQMRTYRLKNAIEMPATDDDGNVLYDEATHEPIMREATLVDLMDEVISHLGEPYVWGGTTPGAFDCSGLVQYAYSKALGTSIPRTTYYQCLQGQDVDFEDLQMGDLVFFANSKGVCTHVGIYLGEGCYIEAPHTGDVVKVTSMADKTPTFAKRILATEDVTYTLSFADGKDDVNDADDVDASDEAPETACTQDDAIQSDDVQGHDGVFSLSEIDDLPTLSELMSDKTGLRAISSQSFRMFRIN